MSQPTNQYSVTHISQALIEELVQALKNVAPFGSVEIYVQNSIITQITMRNIKKTTAESIAKVTLRDAKAA